MNNYPTEDELKKITEWPYPNFEGLMNFIESIWEYADCGYWKQTKKKYYISTAGWSGNEEIIGAMKANFIFWGIYWHSSQRGGHYIFYAE